MNIQLPFRTHVWRRAPGFVLAAGLSVVAAEMVIATAQTAGRPGQGSAQSQVAGQARLPVRPDFKPPGPPQNGPAPFITRVVEGGGNKNRPPDQWSYYPTKEKVEDIYYDTLVAVHVPFEIPFEGGAVNTFFDFDTVWGEPELTARLLGPDLQARQMEDTYAQWNSVPTWRSHSEGLYRVDDGPIDPAAVGLDIPRDPGSPPPPALYSLRTDGPFPVLFRDSGPLNLGSHLGGPRMAFAEPASSANDAWRFRPNPTPIQFRNVKPGWHALWFVVSSPYPFGVGNVPVRPDGTVRATLRVHTLVTRLQRARDPLQQSLTRDELSYIWEGRGPRPERLSDERLTRAHTMDIPLVFHQDGWVLDRVETHPNPNLSVDWLKLKATSTETRVKYQVEVSGDAKANGPGASVKGQVSMFGWKYDVQVQAPATLGKVAQRDVRIDVRVPLEIADGGVGEVSVTRTVEREEGAREALTESPDPFGLRRVSASGPLSEIGNTESLLTKEQYLKERAWMFGDADGHHWLPFVREAPPSEVPWTYRFGARRLQVGEPETQQQWPRNAVEDIGPVKLFTVECGPWMVEAHYRRWKDARRRGSNVNMDATTTVVEEKDPFWAWFPTFSRLVRDKRAAAEAAIERAKVMHPVVQSAQASAAKLRAALDQEGRSVWDGLLGDRVVEIPEETRTRMRARINELTMRHISGRAAIKADANEAHAAYRAIEAELTRVMREHQTRHPELRAWLGDHRRLADEVGLQLAFLIDDPADFEAGIERLEALGMSSHQRLLLSMMLVNNHDLPGAYWQAREAARSDPRSMAAQTHLAELEGAILKSMMAKSHAGVQQAREQFHQFLEQRGFSRGDEGMVRAAVQFVTTGAATGLAGALGLVDAYGEEMAAEDRHLNNAYLGLKVLEGLLARGYPIDKIRGQPATATTPATGMRSEDVFGALAENAPDAPRPSVRQLNSLGACVREALELPELVAIASGDREAFAAAVRAGYFDAKDMDKHWWEHFGDLATMANVAFTAGPNTYVARPGSKLPSSWLWSARESAVVGAAVERGLLAESVTMIAGRAARLDRAIGAFGRSAPGTYLLEMAELSAEYQGSFGTAGQLAWGGGKLTAMLTGFALAYQGANAVGGPVGILVTDALMCFVGDTVAMRQWLRASNVKALDAAEFIQRQVVPAATGRVRQLAGQEADRKALEKITEKLRAARRLTTEEEQVVSRHSTLGRSSVQLQLEPAESELLERALGKLRDAQKLEVAEEALVLRYNIQIELPVGMPREAFSEAISERDGLLAALKKLHGNTPLTPGEEALLVRKNVAIARPKLPTPTGQAGHDSQIALGGAADGVEQGTINGALDASADLADDVASEAAALVKAAGDAKRIAGELATAVPDLQLPTREIAFSPLRGTDFVPQAIFDSDLARAEAMLEAENFDEAATLFERLLADDRAAARSGLPLKNTEYPSHVLEQKVNIARKGLRSGRQVKSAPAAIGDAFSPEEIDRVLKGPLKPIKDVIKEAGDGVSGDILVATTPAPGWPNGKPTHVVKHVKIGTEVTPNADHLQRLVEAEVIGAELARKLGFNVPSVHAEIQWAGKEMKSAKLVYRFVDGSGLDKMGAEQIHALRKEMSKHRAFSMWIGDYDRKLNNYMVIDGHLVPIDAGQGDLRGIMAANGFPTDSPNTMAQFRDEYYDRSFAWLANPGETPAFRKNGVNHFTAETGLRYEHTRDTVAAIEGLCGNDSAELEKILQSGYQRIYANAPFDAGNAMNNAVGDALEALRVRSGLLDDNMRGLNLRSGQRIRMQATTGGTDQAPVTGQFIATGTLRPRVAPASPSDTGTRRPGAAAPPPSIPRDPRMPDAQPTRSDAVPRRSGGGVGVPSLRHTRWLLAA